jgi:ribosomal protein S18 acetylase RimI-like enzyme
MAAAGTMTSRFITERGFNAGDRAAVVALLREYWGYLGVPACFQDFDAELADLPGAYAPPGGQMLLARATLDNALVGCVAVRPVPGVPGMCEMKRLYVRPAARGSGLGRQLALAVMDEARQLGYRHMCLDTLPTLEEAQTLYRSLGFRRTGTAGSDPVVVLYERDLAIP